MRSLNRVMLIGHLAADVELRQTQSGLAVANFPIATNRFTKAEDGEKQEVADFHRVVAFDKLAEVCDLHLKKGMAVYVDGRIVNRSFEDKAGNRHFRTEILLDNLNILTWKKSKNNQTEISIEDPDSEKEEVVELEEEAVTA